MFSYFKEGIKDVNPEKIIDLPTLIKIIKNNPERSLIEWIRTLRKQGIHEYKELKKKLPNITPNCIVGYRNLKDDNFDRNFTAPSGYIYFDTDDIINVDEYKQYFIKKYGHLVSMVSKSSSCSGLSFLFKLTFNITTKEQFFQVWDVIRTTILKDETIDPLCKDIGRAMFISYDPEVYVNYDNEITVEYIKEVKQSIIYEGDNNRLIYSFLENKNTPVSDKNNKKVVYRYTAFNIDEVLSKLITSTSVNVINPIVDFYPIDYAEVFFRKVITDGNKRKYYSSMIHQLVYLNPDIDKIYIYSYLFYINNNYAKPKMLDMELVKLFDFVYDHIKTTGIVRPRTKVKYVHFNRYNRITQNEKKRISNLLNGYYRRYKTINTIIAAKEELGTSGVKITRKLVSKLTGLSIKTVQTHFNSEPIDMDEVIYNLNHPQEIPPRTNQFNSGVRYFDKGTITPTEDLVPQNVPD